MVRYLNEIDKDNIVKLYEMRYEEYGRDYKTVGWGAAADQRLRFDVLSRGLNLRSKSILDVGCGLGDLVPFLEARTNGEFDYTGIDLAPALVASANEMYAKDNIRFQCSEMSDFPVGKEYDLIFMSGALSYRVEDNIGYSKSVIRDLFSITKETLALNFLSSYVDYQAEKNFHYSPEEMFQFSKGLTRWVSLYHDYPLWEFTLQLHATSSIE